MRETDLVYPSTYRPPTHPGERVALWVPPGLNNALTVARVESEWHIVNCTNPDGRKWHLEGRTS